MAPAESNEGKMKSLRSACSSGCYLVQRPPPAVFMANEIVRKVQNKHLMCQKTGICFFPLCRSLFLDLMVNFGIMLKEAAKFHRR